MAIVTKIFDFVSSAENFVGVPGSNCVLTYDSTLSYDGSGGSLKNRISGRSKSGASYWEWIGTWEDLGVPAGATVTNIQFVNTYTRCVEYTTGAASTIGPYVLYASDGVTSIAQLWGGRLVNALESSWGPTASGSNLSVATSYQASNTQLRLLLKSTLATGSSNSAAVSVNLDNVRVNITYTVVTYDNLTAIEISTPASVLEAPILSQVHALNSINISSSIAELTAPSITQTHIFSSSGVLSGTPYLDTSNLSSFVADELLSSDIVSGVPYIQTAILGQKHSLVSYEILCSAPVLGTPNIAQKHNLFSSGIASSVAFLGSPSISQLHSLLSQNITGGVPSLGYPTFGQKYILTVNSILSGVPLLGSPSTAQVLPDSLTANGILASSPILGFPILAQKNLLTAIGISLSPSILGSPFIGQKHNLFSSNISSEILVLENPLISQLHSIVALDILSGLPIIDSPIIWSDIPIPPPEERTCIILDDPRTINIDDYNREIYILDELRTIDIEDEVREIVIPYELREVICP